MERARIITSALRSETSGPNIYEDAIEGAPSAHFWSGGIRIGVNGETSVEGLYAAR